MKKILSIMSFLYFKKDYIRQKGGVLPSLNLDSPHNWCYVIKNN